MAKRKRSTPRADETSSTTVAPDAMTAKVMERRVVAFAEELGRLVGTVQAKAEGWMDRDRLYQQIASVRDASADLLKDLASAASDNSANTPIDAAGEGHIGRSGGVVDAPGKKHRKPPAPDPRAKRMKTQAAQIRTARTMVKTSRHRGRG